MPVARMTLTDWMLVGSSIVSAGSVKVTGS
jgi:hypothetical protein